MWKIAKPAVFGLGFLVVGAAGVQAQTTYPGAYPQYYPAYNYGYDYPGYGYSFGWPVYQSYLGNPYPAPLAYWDPYVWYRPYSDNAGPKASGHGGF
jgi:hypothetical protein